MPRSLPEPAKALAREIVRDILDGKVPSATGYTQTSLGKKVGLDQSRVGRMYAAGSIEGPSYQSLRELARLAGRERDARVALGEEVDAAGDLPEELLAEIARDPSRTAGIDAARTLAHAKGQRLSQEEWRAFIDHGQRLRGTPPESEHEDDLAAKLKAKKQTKKRPRLEVINGGGP